MSITPESPSPESAPTPEEYLAAGPAASVEADPVDVAEQSVEVDLGEDEL